MHLRPITTATLIVGLAGVLLIGPEEALAQAQPLANQSPKLARAEVVVLASLGAAVLFMVILMAGLADRLGKRLGPANWSFTDSWASNLTVLGGILGTLLASGALSEPTRHLTTETYAGLNVMFAVIAVVAGFVYLAVRKTVQVTGAAGKEVQYQGYVLTFCIASTLSIWAVLGQLGTMFLVLDEIHAQGALSLAPTAVFTGLLVVAGFAVFAYAWTTIDATVRWQTDTDTRKQEQAHKLNRSYDLRVEAKDVEPRLEPVSIL